MSRYINIHCVQAEKMDYREYLKATTGLDEINPSIENEKGYAFENEKGVFVWLEKTEFEKKHLKVSKFNTINQRIVDEFIKKDSDILVQKIGDRTTLVQVELINGFVITETSTCVDIDNYNKQIAYDICMRKIKGKIWELLGFLLKTGIEGVK